MAKRKKRNNRLVTRVAETPSPEIIGGVSVIEEKYSSDVELNLDLVERNPSKELEKLSTEKIEIMPQTYIEDVFDIHDISNFQTVVISNPVKEKSKEFITKEELLCNLQFKNKVEKTIKNVLFQKSFDDLLNISEFSKLNRVFFINDEIDEIDILLEEVINYFRKRLAKINLAYRDYQIINAYFETIKTLYNRFKTSEGASKNALKLELETALKMNNYIRYHFF